MTRSKRIVRDRWICETHPEVRWPHLDEHGLDCPGPGMFAVDPHPHKFDEHGFCRVCRASWAELGLDADPSVQRSD